MAAAGPPTHSSTFQANPHRAQSQEMLARAAEHGVAPITWQELGEQKDLVAFSHGKLLACACSCLFQEHLYCAWQELGEQQDLVAFSHGENCFSTQFQRLAWWLPWFATFGAQKDLVAFATVIMPFWRLTD